MGLDIPSLPVMHGLATITDLYGNVRDIRINKDDSKYRFECMFHIYKDVDGTLKNVQTLFINKEYDTDFLTNTWKDCYNLVKEELDAIGITYTDNI